MWEEEGPCTARYFQCLTFVVLTRGDGSEYPDLNETFDSMMFVDQRIPKADIFMILAKRIHIIHYASGVPRGVVSCKHSHISIISRDSWEDPHYRVTEEVYHMRLSHYCMTFFTSERSERIGRYLCWKNGKLTKWRWGRADLPNLHLGVIRWSLRQHNIDDFVHTIQAKESWSPAVALISHEMHSS